MTPTLVGRWQTRLFLMSTAGVLMTYLFGALYRDYRTVFMILGYVLILGLVLDTVYDRWQARRWDVDWPPLLFLFSGLLEGILIWLLIEVNGLPGVPANLAFSRFLAHYAAVWLVTFILVWGPMKVFFLHWRFQGGRVLNPRKRGV